MKKLICFLLVISMIFSVSGCTKSEEPEIIENDVVLGQSSSESSSQKIEISEISGESSSVSESSGSESSKTSSESKPESSFF